MPDERLRIVIEAQDNASAQLKGLSNQLDGLKASGQNAGSGLSGAQQALGLLKAVAASYIVKEGIQMVAQLAALGAEAERTQNSFIAVVGGAREAADMLESLRVATRGAKSDVELMAGATNILALGLADNAEDLGAIVRNVEALGSRFGGTMQIFQLMMSNQSLMRIDSFGVGVEEATKRIDEYKEAGLNAQDAFKTAILELMTEKFESMGGAVEDSKLQMERTTAAWTNFKTELGIGFKDIGSGLAGPGARFLNWLADLQHEYNAARKEGDIFFRNIEATAKAVLRVAEVTPYWTKEANEASKITHALTFEMYEQGYATKDMLDPTWQLTRAKWNDTEASKDAALAARQYADATNGIIPEVKAVTRDINGLALAQSALSISLRGPIKQENKSYNESLKTTTDQMAELQTEIDKLEAGHGRLIVAKKAEALSENELALVVAKRSDAEYQLMVELAKDDKDENITKMAQMRVNIDKYNEQLGLATGTTKTFVDNSKKIAELKEEYGKLSGEIEEMASAHAEATKRILMDMVLQRVSMGPLKDDIATTGLVMKLAAKEGLIDQDTLNSWDKINGIISRVESGALTSEAGFRMLELAINNTAATAEEKFSALEEQTGASKAMMIDLGLEGETQLGNIDTSLINSLKPWADYNEAVGGVAASFLNIPEDVYTTLHVHTINTSGPPGSQPPGKGEPPEHYASGGFSGGGLAWVGERGPELVNLPRGSRVYDAQTSQNIANHNYSITVNTAAQSGTYMQDIALAQAMAQ